METLNHPSFSLRVRIGDKEVEIGGDREEVLATLENLNEIVEKFSEAFNYETKKEEKPNSHSNFQTFPKIARTSQCSDAITSLLSTNWGKTPRTIAEIREAMEANAIFFPRTTLSGVLVWLVKKNKLRRWRDKKKGYVYTLYDEGANV